MIELRLNNAFWYVRMREWLNVLRVALITFSIR